MSSSNYERIRRDPKFQRLVRSRGRFAWTLASIVLALFYGFVVVVAFAPSTLGQSLSPGSKLTVGVVVEFFLFGLFWVLTAFYVRRANREFDQLTADIVRDARRDP
jgi:uncharacterized membrane protein (DUF485 family)